jgi:glycogen(starch) synthase
MLLEISTEVCNQVGGIYQVIRSKAPLMVQRWGERYCLVGPYIEDRAALLVEELIELADGVTLEEVAAKTEATYTVADGLKS